MRPCHPAGFFYLLDQGRVRNWPARAKGVGRPCGFVSVGEYGDSRFVYPRGPFSGQGGRLNSRAVPGVAAPLGFGSTVLRGVGGTCSWSGVHLGRPFRPSPTAPKARWLSGIKDHRPVVSGCTSEGRRPARTPRWYPPMDPRPPVPPHLGVCALPSPPSWHAPSRGGFVVKKKRGLWVGNGDSKWVSLSP